MFDLALAGVTEAEAFGLSTLMGSLQHHLDMNDSTNTFLLHPLGAP